MTKSERYKIYLQILLYWNMGLYYKYKPLCRSLRLESGWNDPYFKFSELQLFNPSWSSTANARFRSWWPVDIEEGQNERLIALLFMIEMTKPN